MIFLLSGELEEKTIAVSCLIYMKTYPPTLYIAIEQEEEKKDHYETFKLINLFRVPNPHQMEKATSLSLSLSTNCSSVYSNRLILPGSEKKSSGQKKKDPVSTLCVLCIIADKKYIYIYIFSVLQTSRGIIWVVVGGEPHALDTVLSAFPILYNLSDEQTTKAAAAY